MVEPEQVLLFLGRPSDTTLEDSAEQAIPVVTTMVKAYVRGNGEGWEPNEELEAVIVTATARLITNPGCIAQDVTAGPFTQSLRGSFTGWTLAEPQCSTATASGFEPMPLSNPFAKVE